MEQYEKKELTLGVTAYLFVTNVPFHRARNDQMSLAACPFGLGIPDFNRPAFRRVSDTYRLKQKHIDAYNIGEAFQTYGRFPTTFDGSLPLETLQGSSRIIIGNTYCFGDPANGGVIGTVTTATVNEQEKEVLSGIVDQNGTSSIWKEPMSALEFADYQAHRDSYFGKILPVGGKFSTPFELFEWFVQSYKSLTREQMLEKFIGAPNFEAIGALSDENLLYEFCEAMVAAFMQQSGWKPA